MNSEIIFSTFQLFLTRSVFPLTEIAQLAHCLLDMDGHWPLDSDLDLIH